MCESVWLSKSLIWDVKINIVEIVTDDVIGLFFCKWKSRMSQLLVNPRWHHSPRQQKQGSLGQPAHDYKTTFPVVLPASHHTRHITDLKEFQWMFSLMVCDLRGKNTGMGALCSLTQIYRKQALKTHPKCQSGLLLNKSGVLTNPLILSWPLFVNLWWSYSLRRKKSHLFIHRKLFSSIIPN